MEHVFKVGMPANFSADEKLAFAALVEGAGEVEGGLLQRLNEARSLVMLGPVSGLVGVAAIKQPPLNRRHRIFEKAGVDLDPKDFAYEFGWAVVAEDYRGKHYTGLITDAALGTIEASLVYSTSRTDKFAMHHTLEKRGFKRLGRDYPALREGDFIALFCRA